MARAHAASACVQSDSIKGLAQSIAKPAYHRALIAEPALRRAVPTLIIAFLITICIGAFVQVVDQYRQKRGAMKRDVSALADQIGARASPARSYPDHRIPDHDLHRRLRSGGRSVPAKTRRDEARRLRAGRSDRSPRFAGPFLP